MTLIGYWPLNEDSGNTVYDHSGNENHGENLNSVQTGVNGILGQTAYGFDGSSSPPGSHINVSDKSYLRTSSFTASTWFNTSGIEGWSAIFGKEYWNNNEGWTVYMGQQGNGYIYFHGPEFSELSTDQQYDDGDWHHLTLVYDGSAAKIYIDGLKKAEGTRSFTDSSITLTVGSRHTNDGSQGGNDVWNGKLQEARFYNHVLTSREVHYLYSVGKSGKNITDTKKS